MKEIAEILEEIRTGQKQLLDAIQSIKQADLTLDEIEEIQTRQLEIIKEIDSMTAEKRND
jgi:hypothetical protein